MDRTYNWIGAAPVVSTLDQTTGDLDGFHSMYHRPRLLTRLLVLVLLTPLIVGSQTRPALAAHLQSTHVEARCVAEVTLKTSHNYRNPFTDCDVDAVFTGPDGNSVRVPAFWDGGGVWRFRYSSAVVGTHRFTTVCTDSSNRELNEVIGVIEVTPYSGGNPLYSRGGIQVAPDHRHFEYADGKPFFWLGDTWWKGFLDD